MPKPELDAKIKSFNQLRLDAITGIINHLNTFSPLSNENEEIHLRKALKALKLSLTKQ